jgi:hypothetical protein
MQYEIYVKKNITDGIELIQSIASILRMKCENFINVELKSSTYTSKAALYENSILWDEIQINSYVGKQYSFDMNIGRELTTSVYLCTMSMDDDYIISLNNVPIDNLVIFEFLFKKLNVKYLNTITKNF